MSAASAIQQQILPQEQHDQRWLQEEEEVSTTTINITNPALKFGMTGGDSSFFDPIRQGFLETCQRLGAECAYFSSNETWFRENYNETEDLAHCVPQMRDLMAENYTGAAFYCGKDHPVWQDALDRGMVLSTYDIKLPDKWSSKIPYVGTDNSAVGESMARLLRLLKQVEQGETATYYAFSFTRIPERYQGFVREIEKNNHRSDRGHWEMVTTNLTGKPNGDDLIIGEALSTENYTAALEKLAQLNPDAVIFMNQSPMRHDNYSAWVQRHRWRNITIVGLQGNDEELQTLARRNVDGLVGQVAYDIGRVSAQTLYDQAMGKKVPPNRFTNLINYNLVPEQLPAPQVDQNLLGNSVVYGYVAFAIVAATALACLVWTVVHRQGTVVRSSQPMFLAMTATGILLLASAILPLSMETGDEDYYFGNTDIWARGICMSPVWLIVLGFSVTFSALFAKTWRVNKFFNSSNRFERIQVREKDVLVPFGVVMTSNILILTVWTAVDPLTYSREFEEGTDLYNREIASNGYCRSDHAWYYLAPLGIINLALLVVACWQAYQARNIKSEFAEASYIGLAVFSFMQAFITGIPVVAVVRDDPQAFYMVLTSIIFVLCMVILLLIFFPKFRMEQKYKTMSPRERRESLAVSVRTSMMSKRNSDSTTQPGEHFKAERRISGLSAPIPAITPKQTGNHRGSDPGVMPRVQEDEEALDPTEDPTDRTVNPFGSYVEKVDKDDVMQDKKSTYAPAELDEELRELEEREKQSTSNTSGLTSSDGP